MAKDANMDNTEQQRKPLAIILVKRSAILLLVLYLVAFFYWTVGSFRFFLAETQLMLLALVHWSALGLVLTSVYGIFATIGFAFARRYRLRLSGLLGYILLIALGTGGLAASDILALLHRGLDL
jgi:hypothetical protein